MEHTIFVNGPQVAVLVTDSPTHYTVTAYVNDSPSVAWEGTSYAEAERWAKATIGYPSET